MINGTIKDRAVLFLEEKMSGSNELVKAELAKGNVIIRDESIFVNKAILVGTNGLIEVVDKTQERVVGITSLTKGKTPEKTSMGITGIIARFAPSVASSDVTNQPYSEFLYDYAGALRIPKEIQNMEIEVTIGTVKVFEGRLAKLFVNGRESNTNGSAQGFMSLKAPKFIKGSQEVQILVRPVAPTPGTATQYVHLQIELDGVATSFKL